MSVVCITGKPAEIVTRKSTRRVQSRQRFIPVSAQSIRLVRPVTGQLAYMPTRRQPTRTQVKSWTIQLAHRATRRQDN